MKTTATKYFYIIVVNRSLPRENPYFATLHRVMQGDDAAGLIEASMQKHNTPIEQMRMYIFQSKSHAKLVYDENFAKWFDFSLIR